MITSFPTPVRVRVPVRVRLLVPLDEDRQHGDDSIENVSGFAQNVFLRDSKHLTCMENCGAFGSRPTSHSIEACLVARRKLTSALSDVIWDRKGGPTKLVGEIRTTFG